MISRLVVFRFQQISTFNYKIANFKKPHILKNPHIGNWNPEKTEIIFEEMDGL
jgi:hypothetical protein